MTDQELIKQLKTLKNIKPSKEWAILCKQEITGIQAKEEQIKEQVPGETQKSIFAIARERIEGVSETISNMSPVFKFKPAFATIACFGLVLSVFGVAQGALPGDPLYPAKKITEKIQFNLASEQEKPDMQIAMTSKKMQELNQVVQANLGKNLAPAIQEVEQSAQETAKTLEKLTKSVKVMNVPAETAEKGQAETAFVQIDTEKIKETLAQIQEIKSAKLVVEDALGAKVATPELDEAVTDCYKTLVEMEIQAMESQTLLEEQEALLFEIQELYAQKQYQQAFEKFLIGQ
jgi:hypothetical protein